MFLPRFTIRTLLVITAGCAVLFLILGVALRGQSWAWAWGAAIGVLSLAATAVVHAAWFGIVQLFARVTAKPHPASAATRWDDQRATSVAENAAARKEATP